MKLLGLARMLGLAAVLAAGGCAGPAGSRAGLDPATGLPACSSQGGVLPNSGSRIAQTANSLPAGAKDLSASCLQSTSRGYLLQ